MAPIRRYLRITKYSVLEVRIYLDNPALVNSWLLHARDPVLPKVMASVRPLVLPKLREEQERERSRKKSTKKRSIKDVVVEGAYRLVCPVSRPPSFAVVLMRCELFCASSNRHSILHRRKHFRDKTQTNLTSNSSKLTGGAGTTCDEAMLVEDNDKEGGVDHPQLRRESDADDEPLTLQRIPAVPAPECHNDVGERQTKRTRGQSDTLGDAEGGDGEGGTTSSGEDDKLFVHDSDSSEFFDRTRRPSKRQRVGKAVNDNDEDLLLIAERGQDDKKKLAMDISYEGFAIYGRVLCLVVKRRGAGIALRTTAAASNQALPAGTGAATLVGGMAAMENWITSTQMAAVQQQQVGEEMLDA